MSMTTPQPTGITAKSTLGDLLAGMGIDLTNMPKLLLTKQFVKQSIKYLRLTMDVTHVLMN